MINEPKLSVVIPTYNRPDRLSKSLACYLNNKRHDIEFIIMDNASPSDIEPLVKSIAQNDPRVIFHRNPQNIGFSRNLFHGFMHAKAPYIIVMPDDDFVTENFFDLVIEAFENNSSLGIVHSYLDPVERHRHVTERGNGLDSYPKGMEAVSKIFMYSGAVPGLAFRHSAINYNDFTLDQSVYPQVNLSAVTALNWDVGFIRSNLGYVTLGGQEDSIIVVATNAMNRPNDYGVVERLNVLLRIKGRLPKKQGQLLYIRQSAVLLKWASDKWLAMEQLDKKYAKRMLIALFKYNQIKLHPIFWALVLKKPSLWRFMQFLKHLPRLIFSKMFWQTSFLSVKLLTSFLHNRKKV